MNFLDSIVSILTIATLVSSGFNYLVIRPIQKTIDTNTKVLSELKREVEMSAADRRALDARMTAMEMAHRINNDRIARMEDMWDNLNQN